MKGAAQRLSRYATRASRSSRERLRLAVVQIRRAHGQMLERRRVELSRCSRCVGHLRRDDRPIRGRGEQFTNASSRRRNAETGPAAHRFPGRNREAVLLCVGDELHVVAFAIGEVLLCGVTVRTTDLFVSEQLGAASDEVRRWGRTLRHRANAFEQEATEGLQVAGAQCSAVQPLRQGLLNVGLERRAAADPVVGRGAGQTIGQQRRLAEAAELRPRATVFATIWMTGHAGQSATTELGLTQMKELTTVAELRIEATGRERGADDGAHGPTGAP
jgi:hypothetical protein